MVTAFFIFIEKEISNVFIKNTKNHAQSSIEAPKNFKFLVVRPSPHCAGPKPEGFKASGVKRH
jgi:hypothetical protein